MIMLLLLLLKIKKDFFLTLPRHVAYEKTMIFVYGPIKFHMI